MLVRKGSRIVRTEGISNNRKNIIDVINNLDENTIEELSNRNKHNQGDFWGKAVSLAKDYFDVLKSIRNLDSSDRNMRFQWVNNIAGWLLSVYNWKKDRVGFNKFKNTWYKDVWSDDTDDTVLELKKELSVFDPIFDFLKKNVSLSGRDSLSDFNKIKSLI